jgi:hypothetical protein
MTIKRVALVVLALIVGCGIYGWAQVVPAPLPVPPGVISGTDLGFSVERTERNAAVGKLMVRVNGKWMEAQFSSQGRVFPLQTK